MKIVLHDYFESAEGGGRLSLILAQVLKADIGFGFKNPGHPFFDEYAKDAEKIDLKSFTQVPLWRQFKLSQAFLKKTHFLNNYKCVIYSGSYAPLAVNNSKKALNIYYCHTPPRFVYDKQKFFLSSLPLWQRPMLSAFINYFKACYEDAVSKMDIIVANSENVQKRIKNFLKYDSIVVCPPCETQKFKWAGQDDFYFSVARLDPLKRVDMIVRAFLKMPEKKLIVASTGQLLSKIRKISKGAKNIRVLGQISENKLRKLTGSCIATIYLPVDEDFGMSPIESMSAGKPVIGVAEGGLKESIIHDKTGILLSKNFCETDIAGAVKNINARTAKKMRKSCEEQAKNFDTKIFMSRMQKILNQKSI
ncbi:Glycosyltransferase [Candidatus Magnetomoraceae bacterium gMMP-15]